MSEHAIVTYQVDTDGIAEICWDQSGAPVNAINDASITSLREAVDEVLSNADVTGIVLTSAKNDFVVGADLKEFLNYSSDASTIIQFLNRFHLTLRLLETCGKPVVAAVNGSALGGGLEYALAAHYRIAAKQPKARFGFPEAMLGLLPGGGGTQRYGRMVGVEQAFGVISEAKQVKVEQALELKMLDEIVEPEQLLARAKQWIKDNPEHVEQPWDKKGFRLPGGAINSPRILQLFTGGQAMLRKKTNGNYPAQQNILQCLYEGLQLPIDKGLAIEIAYLAELMVLPQTQKMIRSYFFSMQELNKLKRRPKDVEKQRFNKVGVLGAGMMGAGIAYSSALSGIDVVLLDTEQSLADKGKTYSESIMQKRVSRGRSTQAQMDALLSKIHPTTDFNDLADCDLIIEAVFEHRDIKADVTRKTEAVIGDNVVFASNTSTLPITGLASVSQRPEQFIGLHFFSPVDKMKLVEIILGEQTNQETLAKALDFVQQIRKTPIVVNDSRGFYTSRVFKTYVLEGVALLSEGVAPALIENAGKMAGMPVGPLALLDEVSLELVSRILAATKADLGDEYRAHPAETAILKMVNEFKRIGKKSDKGFYDYSEAGKQLWSGLAEAFPASQQQPSLAAVQQRLLHIQALETVRCLQEKVVTTAAEADIGSILGWGFAPQTGGVLSYLELVGIEQFVADCESLSASCGERFVVPELLKDKQLIEHGFYPS